MKQNLISEKRTKWRITCGLRKYIAKRFDSPYHVAIFDQLGRQIISYKLTQSTEIVNLSSTPSGIYILKINDLIGNTISTKKVIILK